MERDEFPATEEKERQWVEEHLDHPGKIVLLAEAAGTIIGNVSFENGPFRRIAHRGSFGICRGQGVAWSGRGDGLASHVVGMGRVESADRKGRTGVFAVNERAIRLYRRLGFVEEGRRPKDVKLGPGQYVDTVAMHRFVK